MTRNKNKKKWGKRISIFLLAQLVSGTFVLFAGCGAEPPKEAEEEIVLLDPPAVELTYETAMRRTLLSAETHTAVICPPSRQYGLETAVTFDSYQVCAGQEVGRGKTLLYGNTESIDKNIEKMETAIADAEESYREYMDENTPKQEELLEKIEEYEEIMEEIAETKGKNWQSDYNYYEKLRTDTRQTEVELEQAIKERKELYELDHAYQLSQLAYLKQDRQKAVLSAGMSGFVADMRILQNGDRTSGGQALMTLADHTVKELKCEYIPVDAIMNAEEIYAVVNGKRYEVEPVLMDTAEYTRLKSQNGTVYSTFTFVDEPSDFEFGDNALLVMIKQRLEDVLTISTELIRKDGSVSYVYVLNGNKREYTTIKTGEKDGLYTQILSGLNEGDRIVTEKKIKTGETGETLQAGDVGEITKLSGKLYFPFSDWVKNPVTYGTVYLEEVLVQENQPVEKGEVLARIRVEGDSQELKKNQKKLEREEERLNDLKNAEQPDEKAIEAKEESIAELRELIHDMETDYALTAIRAASAGVVTKINTPGIGEAIPSGSSLFLIGEESMRLIQVADDKNLLMYGQKVDITYTGSDGQKSISGTVVTLNPTAADKTLTDKTALVQVSAEDMKELTGGTLGPSGKWRSTIYNIQARTNAMENVVLVPKNAVKKVGGDTYVLVKQENGEAVYQSFLAGGSDYLNYWVVDGLTEGMTIWLE